ncbi:MAG: hypothetical protein NUV78_02935 [Candidatus Zambryskibacteria bacterium]|nr:hypothetical protein [Candidatus Zambryskibacteria bacterium]
MDGPVGDDHSSFSRRLSAHDKAYLETSSRAKKDLVFNWRMWTGLSKEEVGEVEGRLGHIIPQGCLQENLLVSGIPNFTQLLPTTRLVFPERGGKQTILAVWEENTPCHTVGERLETHHRIPGLSSRFIAEARRKRGVMGIVLSAGVIQVGDEIRVYPPVR